MANIYDEALAKATADAHRLKAYFPFRIVWLAIDPETCEFYTGATPTKRQANDYARKGWDVFIIGGGK